MKPSLHPWLLLMAALTGGIGIPARANVFSDNFEMLVVSESAKGAPEELRRPTSYVAYDGGYIEAGDPIAGDTPPTADSVRRSLNEALVAKGFRPTALAPALVVTYHWGVLRVDHRQIQSPYAIRPNFIARIELVSTHHLGAEVENHILSRQKAGGMDLNVSSPAFLVGPLESVVQHARAPRIFVIVSAYDFKAMANQHEAKLVWTTKLSAQETSGEMLRVIPPLISQGGSYFATDSPDVRIVTATLARKSATPSPPIYPVPPPPQSLNLDKDAVANLINAERARFSGGDAEVARN